MAQKSYSARSLRRFRKKLSLHLSDGKTFTEVVNVAERNGSSSEDCVVVANRCSERTIRRIKSHIYTRKAGQLSLGNASTALARLIICFYDHRQ